MTEDNKIDPSKDTSKQGREEEVIKNVHPADSSAGGMHHATHLPVKDKSGQNETEGERRFKEGMANNNDTSSDE